MISSAPEQCILKSAEKSHRQLKVVSAAQLNILLGYIKNVKSATNSIISLLKSGQEGL